MDSFFLNIYLVMVLYFYGATHGYFIFIVVFLPTILFLTYSLHITFLYCTYMNLFGRRLWEPSHNA